MDCRKVEQALVLPKTKGIETLTPLVRAHIEGCKSCQELARILELPSENMQLDPGQIDRLQKMILGDLRPVRRLLPSWVFLCAFLLFLLALSCLGVLYLGPAGWFVLMLGQKIAVFVTLAASAALLAFSLVRQMVPGQESPVRPVLLPFGLLVLLSLVVASVFQVRADPHFLQSGEACLRAGIPYAIPAAFVFWLILRCGAILSPRVAGATTGMLAGLVSTTVLEAHCPDLNLWHILVWHFGFAVLGLVAGLLVAIAGQAIRRQLT
jgi:hypothetical protein